MKCLVLHMMRKEDINGHITYDEVFKTVNKLPNEVIKNKDVINILTRFMNMCFMHNIIPTLWTKSIIKPIPKGSSKDPNVLLNY